MVTLCTVRTTGRPLLRCWAALRRPLATATWWATCQVWRVAWQAGLLGPWVAVVARTPLAYGPEDVLGLSLAGLARAFRVVVCHVGPSAGLVQLK